MTIEGASKFKVNAHPCDRDYMYMSDMKGCAPIEGVVLEMGTGSPLGIQLDKSRAMYAQTIQRNHAIPIQKSDKTYFDNEMSGFLSMQLKQRKNDADGQEFKMCKNIEQCLQDPFLFNGDRQTREIYDSSTLSMKDWTWSHTESCGIFGVSLPRNDSRCSEFQSGSSYIKCCQIDNATAVQYYILCNPTTRRTLQQSVTTRATLPTVEITEICESMGSDGVYATSDDADSRDIEIYDKAAKLNRLWDILTNAIQWKVSSESNKYIAKTTLSDTLMKLITDHAKCNPGKMGPFCTKYHTPNGVEISGGYYLGRYALYEFPIAWWHKCMMLRSDSFSQKLLFNKAISCSAWTNRFDVVAGTQYNGYGKTQFDRMNDGITHDTLYSALLSFKDIFITSFNRLDDIYLDTKHVCASDITYKPMSTLQELYKNHKIDCITHILGWGYNEDGAPTKWKNVNNACYEIKSSRISDSEYQPPAPLKRVKTWMTNTLSESMLEYDFIANSTSSDAQLGILMAEFVPKDLPFQNVVSLQGREGVTSSRFPADQNTDPCIQTTDVLNVNIRFLDCAPDTVPVDPNILTEKHCNSVQAVISSIISRLKSPKKSNNEFNNFQLVDELDVEQEMKTKFDTCLKDAADKGAKHKCDTSKSGSPCSPDASSLTKLFNKVIGLEKKWDFKVKKCHTWGRNLQSSEKRVFCNGNLRKCYSTSYVPTVLDEAFIFLNGLENSYNGGSNWDFRTAHHCWTHCDVEITTTGDKTLDYILMTLNVLHGNEYYQYGRQWSIKNSEWVQGGECKEQDVAPREITSILLKKLFDPLWSFYAVPIGGAGVQGCLPEKNPLATGTQLIENKRGGSAEKCFSLRHPVGRWNCSFDASLINSFSQNADDFRKYSSKTPHGTDLRWSIDNNRILDIGTNMATNVDKMAYTMYLSTLNYFFSQPPSTSNLFVKPQPLDMYSYNKDWLQKFTLFDVSNMISHDEGVEALKLNQVCNGPNSTVIQYGECSNSQLYEDASIDYEAFVRKSAGTVIPAHSVLVWRGLSYSHSISSTLPSWSMHKRQDREVFGKWILNTGDRCRSGSAANSICHIGQSKKETVTPWVGGDFNPFEMCDTVVDGGGTSSTSVVQETVSCSCNPVICKDSQADYYANQPSTLCLGKSGASLRPKWANVPRRVTQYEENSNANSPDHFNAKRLTPSTSTMYENNLCVHQPLQPHTCKHPQGMLGGRQGLTMQTSSTDLYRDTTPKYTDVTLYTVGMGLFVNGGNPIYRAEKTLDQDLQYHGIMKQNKNDIAGHHIVLKVMKDDQGTPYMLVDRIPLSYRRVLVSGAHTRVKLTERELLFESQNSSSTHGNSGWLVDLQSTMRSEQDRVDKLYPRHVDGLTNKKWSCPLRRLAFWSQVVDDPDFSPLVPSPPRIERLFGSTTKMNFGTRSHPTMEFGTSNRMPNIYTSNGFCFCVSNPSKCTVMGGQDGKQDTQQCSIEDTIKSLYDNVLRKSHTLTASTSQCIDQIDWPYEGGKMRDGTVMGARRADGTQYPTPDVCDITDRLPPFWYRYMPNGTITQPGSTSLHKGGACHMGVAPEIPKNFVYKKGICRKFNETRFEMTVICHPRDGTTPETLTLSKTLSKAPDWAVNQMKKKRQRCDTCPATPVWKDQGSDTQVPQVLPKGPEVSYGIPFRWSAARLLAGDLKALLCGTHHNNTSECKSLMDESKWGLQSFIEHFTGNASLLFKTKQTNETRNQTNKTHVEFPALLDIVQSTDKIDDTELWNGANASWIGCSQQPDGRCFGGMKREEWYSPERGAHCVDKFTDLVRSGKINESTVPLDICTLDASLNDMCQKLKNALLKIHTGNCIAAGGCHPKAFVYTPGMYSQSNQDFVRGSVINFYESYGLETSDAFDKQTLTNLDLVCPLDDEEDDMRARNNDLTKYCASRQLQGLQEALKIARRVVHLIVEIGYIETQLVFTFARLLIPGLGDATVVVQEIEFWFLRLVMIIFDSLKEIGNLLFRMISDTGGIGDAMKTLVNMLCGFVNFLLDFYNTILCQIMKNVTAPICQGLIDVLKPVLSFFKIPTGIFDLLEKIIDTIRKSTCNTKWECNEMLVNLPTQQFGVLPVTSRCWADYTPNVDDASSYACSRSDTCSSADLTYGVTNQVNFTP
jgi:hypothetical protein